MFSIIIPLYNKETTICKTIESVLKQSHQQFELIIINDGSTDNSLDVIESIVDSRIKIINKPNGGVSSARNKGIEEANFEYIAFLDADDIWGSRYLEDMYTLIKEYPLAEVYSSNFEFVNQNKKTRPATNGLSRGYLDNYFKLACKSAIIHSSSVIIMKSAFLKVGGFHEKMKHGEDLDLWTRLGVNCKIAYSTTLSNQYFLGSINSSASFVPKPDQMFAYYIDLEKTVNYYHFKYLKILLIKRTLRYLLLDHNFNYFKIMVLKQWRNLIRLHKFRFT